jgi:DNA repair protein RecN (Recombination protein N)
VLSFLSIRNLAIIDRLELELYSGMTVVTGETGAGKSMLLSALTMLLGGNVSRESIRSGEDSMSLEAVWDNTSGSLPFGPLLDGEPVPEEVPVRRTVSLADGSRRDRLLVADRLAGRSAMQEIAGSLVNISSQHEYIGLMKKSEHLAILDRYAGHAALLDRMESLAIRYETLAGELEELAGQAARRETRAAELTTRVAELSDASVQPGEEEDLHQRISRLAHSVDIATALGQAVDQLYEGERDVISTLSSVERVLVGAIRFEPALSPCVDRLASARVEVEDIVSNLRHLAGGVEVDPAQLDHLQDRLALLQKLKRRYAVDSADGLVALLDEARTELSGLEDVEDRMARLGHDVEGARKAMLDCSAKLHEARARVARKLEKALQDTLSLLEMKKARFAVRVELDEARTGRLGGDDVEFLFSANAGEEPKSLRKVASGGELSRVLLALKAVLAGAYPVPTYVFDEIDSGIGGKTALAVGRLLAGLARSHQVICITHTAQLAAFADHHYVVSKEEKGGRTHARLALLESGDDRVREVARMLSGLEDSPTALSHAAELIAAARNEMAG